MTILDLFSGVGGFAKAFEDTFGTNHQHYYSDVDKYALAVYKYQFPNAIALGDVTQIDATKLPPIDFMFAGFPCFTEDMLVTTIDGQKYIKDVVVGDFVLTHKGRYRKVLDVGTCYNKTRVLKGYGFLPIETTNEHPFYVKNRVNIWNGNGYTRTLQETTWQEAKNLKPFKQYVSTPLVNDIYENIYNEDFWYLIGRYIGDGWLAHRYRGGVKKLNDKAVICCGFQDLEILTSIVKKVFGSHYSVSKEKTGYKFHITQKWFADFLTIIGSGAGNKQIPSKWFGLEKLKAKALIDGYLSADGTNIKNGKGKGFCTISKKLCISVMILGKKIGYEFSQYVYTNAATCIIEGRVCNQAPFTYTANYLFDSNRQQYFTETNYTWKPVKENKETGEIKKVYNMTVEEDNTYVINGICVHNCQNLSIAGNRLGLEGVKSGLFYPTVELWKQVKPKYWIFENVASMKKEEKQKITDILGVEAVCINSSLLSAQNRKRYFWCSPNFGQITQPQDRHIYLKDILESGEGDRLKSYCLDASYYKGTNLEQYLSKSRQQIVFEKPNKLCHINKSDSQGNRVYGESGKSVTLASQSGGLGAKTGLYRVAMRNSLTTVQSDSMVLEPSTFSLSNSRQNLSITANNKANCLTSSFRGNPDGNGRPRVIIPDEYVIRKLTPIETCRLQTFPDNWNAKGVFETKNGLEIKDISNTQRYKQMGNGVTVEVIKHILSFVKN